MTYAGLECAFALRPLGHIAEQNDAKVQNLKISDVKVVKQKQFLRIFQ